MSLSMFADPELKLVLDNLSLPVEKNKVDQELDDFKRLFNMLGDIKDIATAGLTEAISVNPPIHWQFHNPSKFMDSRKIQPPSASICRY